MLNKTSRLLLLLFPFITIIAFLLSGCDIETGSSANTLVPTATVRLTPSEQPSSTPLEIATATLRPAGTATPVPLPSDTPDIALPTPEAPQSDIPQQAATATETDAPAPPTKTPRPKLTTPTRAAPVRVPTAEAVSTIPPEVTPDASATTGLGSTVIPGATATNGRMVNGTWYDAYVPAATKLHQYYHYTCEFDAAWVVLKTNGIDATLQDQIAIVGLDTSTEPRYEETAQGIFIYGGDIMHHYSGDYTKNFLARSTGAVIGQIFEHYGLSVTPVHTKEEMEAALRRGELVWIKTTADFKPGKPATWVMPDGTTYLTVLGNDHAAIVMGYNATGALIRDVLGPTSTNENRQYEYEVPWDIFLAAWAQQQNDGLAVGR